MHEGYTVKQIVAKPVINQHGGFIYHAIDETVFAALAAQVPEENFMAENGMDARVIQAFTNREAAIGTRKLNLGPNEAALVMIFDSTGFGHKKKLETGMDLSKDMDWVRKNTEFGIIVRLDLEGFLNRLSADMIKMEDLQEIVNQLKSAMTPVKVEESPVANQG